ncbi:hypothetical protein DLM77_12060 [Leptospira yasudae]|uniref:Uncharacterized protein n=2 Tax=Leptospira yasudae TaxID=2202201 RepID=A0ABX9M283_9LEPT|nr:hypothetical protein DLM77_12060 [Leptospira yasudae]
MEKGPRRPTFFRNVGTPSFFCNFRFSSRINTGRENLRPTGECMSSHIRQNHPDVRKALLDLRENSPEAMIYDLGANQNSPQPILLSKEGFVN